MQLSKERCKFTLDLAKLLQWADLQPGYNVCLNEVKRTSTQAQVNAESGSGIKDSLHLLALAADVLLYKDGVYLKDTADYKWLGDYWKSLSPDNRWGGDFKKPDGNHFSHSIGDGRA